MRLRASRTTSRMDAPSLRELAFVILGRPDRQNSMRDNTSGDGTDGARPLLVLVAGAPASGKSTLARLLAARLALPLLPRDPITHALADALRPASREQMQPLVLASFQVFYALIAEFLQADGVVAETNF